MSTREEPACRCNRRDHEHAETCPAYSAEDREPMSTPTDDDIRTAFSGSKTYNWQDGAVAKCTVEGARELAKRWAFNEAGAPAYGADAICEPEPLDDTERERLFAWVRERVADWLAAGAASGMKKVGNDAVRGVLLLHVAQDLAMSLADCEALIGAAKGWPS